MEAIHFTDFRSSLDGYLDLVSDIGTLKETDRCKRPLVEWCLLNGFVSYEKLISAEFLFCMQRDAFPYVTPRDESHAIELLQSFNANTATYIDWADPKRVREKSEHYLGVDNPLSLCIQTHSSSLEWHRKLRNHVAHHSTESQVQFRKVVAAIIPAPQSALPEVHEFLVQRPDRGPAKGRMILGYLLNCLQRFGEDLFNVSQQIE